jgi:ankyrin repeat protein
MDALPLPPCPALDPYLERAKGLVRASGSPGAGAVRAWAADWLADVAQLQGAPVTAFVQDSIDRAVAAVGDHLGGHGAAEPRGACTLDDAQAFIARAHGFDGWRQFADHVTDVVRPGSEVHAFEAAADAVVGGDTAGLEARLRLRPALVRARSTRRHRATLLHYVAANGVEDFRQRSPANAPEVARLLLAAGAEPDALAETYGGGRDQTTLNLLVSSAHPAAAGLHAPLIEALLDFGAAVDGLDGNGSPLSTAIAFGYRDAADALAARGARVDTAFTAAALGRADLVDRMVGEDGTLRSGFCSSAPAWLQLPADPRGQVQAAMVAAAKFGRTAVVGMLLGRAVGPGFADQNAMTALHWAAGLGHRDVVELLLRAQAPLEVRNVWGGTVLDSTVYFARHARQPGVDYAAMVERLLAAGADARAVTPFPTGDAAIDALLRRHGR